MHNQGMRLMLVRDVESFSYKYRLEPRTHYGHHTFANPGKLPSLTLRMNSWGSSRQSRASSSPKQSRGKMTLWSSGSASGFRAFQLEASLTPCVRYCSTRFVTRGERYCPCHLHNLSEFELQAFGQQAQGRGTGGFLHLAMFSKADVSLTKSPTMPRAQ